MLFRHAINYVNNVAARANLESAYLVHMRVLINEVNYCFSKGSPHEPTYVKKVKLDELLFKEVSDTNDKATTVTKGERSLRALKCKIGLEDQ